MRLPRLPASPNLHDCPAAAVSGCAQLPSHGERLKQGCSGEVVASLFGLPRAPDRPG